MILTRGKSLEVPLGELHRVGVPASVSAAKDSGQPDIARIVKETLQALNGNKSAADQLSRKQREEIVPTLAEIKGHLGGLNGAPLAWASIALLSYLE